MGHMKSERHYSSIYIIIIIFFAFASSFYFIGKTARIQFAIFSALL